jgi:uncharacterized protein
VIAVRRWILILFCLGSLAARAQEVIPPAPDRYFNDYAHVVDAATADQLNTKLENLEKESGNQVVVAIYPKMQSESSIDDYAVRVFRAWKVGQKAKNNGVVLFVFINDRKMFIEVGYGLEGALPDALGKQITEYEIKPRFKTGDYAGGLKAGVDAIIAATRHEYKGNGVTANSGIQNGSGINPIVLIMLLVFGFYILMFVLSRFSKQHGWVIGSGGWGGFSGGGWGGGGWGGGGGFSGGGGGGFSGGGGSSGGGGAGSSW